jgi:hypothetical protein
MIPERDFIDKNEEEKIGITWLFGDLGSVNIRPKTQSILAIFTAALFDEKSS